MPEDPTDRFVSETGRMRLVYNSGRLFPDIDKIELSSDGALLFGKQDGNASVWRNPTEEAIATWQIPSSVRSISASPDGKHLAISGIDGLQVHRVGDGEKIWEAPAILGRPIWSHDGKYLAGSTSVTSAAVWTSSGAVVWKTDQKSIIVVEAMDFSADGTQLLIVSMKKLLSFNAQTGEPIDSFEFDSSFGYSFLLSGPAKLLLFPKLDGTVRYDFAVPPEKKLSTLGPGARSQGNFQISASGTLAASVDSRVVSVWNPRTGELIDKLTSHGWGIAEMAISADGKRIALSTNVSKIFLWEIPDI